MKDGILGLGVMATYPWVCLAIRGNNSCLCLTTNRQKNLGQKNGFARNCAAQFQTAIFLPFYLFAFPLVAAEGRTGSFASFVVPLFTLFFVDSRSGRKRGETTKDAKDTKTNGR